MQIVHLTVIIRNILYGCTTDKRVGNRKMETHVGNQPFLRQRRLPPCVRSMTANEQEAREHDNSRRKQ